MTTIQSADDRVQANVKPTSIEPPDEATAPVSPAPATGGMAARIVRAVVSVCLVLLLLGSSGFAARWLLLNAPEQATVPGIPTLPTVDVMTPVLGEVTVTVRGFGEVVPAREASIAPEVVGRIVEVGSTIEPGGFVTAGDLLFRIDPVDYKIAVAQARADLARAQAELELERGRAIVAQEEWARFRETLDGVETSDASAALANREPQQRQAEASVQQAEAALALAQLNLERTEVRAPFSATVLREMVEVGLRVGPETSVVDLAGTEAFWVTVAVPPSQGARLSNASTDHSAEATVSVDTGLGDRSARGARLVRILPDVDRSGRMVRVLVAVDDPLGMAGPADIVRLGDYASVAIDAGTIQNVVELPREAIRENGEIWVLSEEDRLRVLPVAVRWRDEDTVIASAEFGPGDRVITSFLSDPIPGQSLRAREAR